MTENQTTPITSKKINVHGFTAGLRRTDFENKKQKLAKKGWVAAEYHDGGMSNSYALFTRPLSYQEPKPSKKQYAMIVWGILLIFIAIGGYFDDSDESVQPQPKTKPPTVKTTQPQAPKYTTKAGTLERYIEEALGSKKVIAIDLLKQVAGEDEGKYLAKIQYIARDSIAMKRTLITDTMSIVRLLSQDTRTKNIGIYMFMPHFNTINNYGNSKLSQIAKLVIRQATAQQVSWDNMMPEQFEALLKQHGELLYLF